MIRREKARDTIRHHTTGIRWRIFLCLVLFVLMLLMTLWFFQIRMLGYFYEREKYDELELVSEDLISHLEMEHFDDRVDLTAKEKNICVCVFRIEGSTATAVADADANSNCVVHHLSAELLSNLYDNAKKNGGTYDKRMQFVKNDEPGEDDFYVPGMHDPSKAVNVLFVRLVTVEGREYLLVLDSMLSPIRTIISTLQVQFSWIVMLLLIATVVMAFVLSRLIVAPLTSITQRAGELAAGNYDVSFEGFGYREVEELADTLNFAAREISATDHLQKELIANISHDLRTPLTMIKGYSELMRDLPGENNAENAQIIIDETTRLSELVSDLLDLSKLQAGTKKPECDVFDLAVLVRDTMERYEALIRHEGYRISFEGEGPAPVLADRTMILQVIYNLINNAVNYTGESKCVRVTLSQAEGRVRFAVADDGEGIPPEQINEIWDRYYRVDKVHKRAVMGTGLGLSIVKSVLEAHHAAYGVESAVGVGSVFWFELPLQQPNEN